MQWHPFGLPSWVLACMVPPLRAKLPEFLLGPGVVVIQVCRCLPVKDVGPGLIRPPWKVGLLVVAVKW